MKFHRAVDIASPGPWCSDIFAVVWLASASSE